MVKLFIFTCIYNGKDYVNNLINSMLRQDSNDFIHYIYDDGSTDGINDELIKYQKMAKTKTKPFKVVIERNPKNIGNLAATKHCLDIMNNYKDCTHFGWVNADDKLSNNYVSTFIKTINKHNSYDIFLAQYATYEISGSNSKYIESSFDVNKQSLRNGNSFANFMHHYFAYGCFIASINFYCNYLKGDYKINPLNKYCFNDKQIFYLFSISNAKLYHISKKHTLYYFLKRSNSLSNIQKKDNYNQTILKTYESMMKKDYKINLAEYIEKTGVYVNILNNKNITRKGIIKLIKQYNLYKKTHQGIYCYVFDKLKIVFAYLFLELFKKLKFPSTTSTK